MGLNATFIQFGPKVATFFKEGMELYATMAQSEESISPDALSFLLLAKMDEWNPTVRGVQVLDDETKAAGARFLSGIICAIGPNQGRAAS